MGALYLIKTLRNAPFLQTVEAVEQRVFDRMIAERQRIAEQFRSEGEGRAAEIDGDTKRQLAVIQSEANREAEGGRADAEASRIYSEAFGADPEFYAFLRTLMWKPDRKLRGKQC
ncbi:MAG: membrane protease subunit HflC [Lentimonas sp.]|jgi:membrane protease subunit HflC